MAKSLDIIDPKKEISTEDERLDEGDDMIRARSERKEEGGGGLFYLIIGIIAVIVSTSLALYILFKDDSSSNKAATASVTSTSTAAASSTSTASATVSSSATGTQVASASPAASQASSSFKYTNEQIRIANGNGISGEAAKVQTLLEGKGYKITSVGNASKTYETSIVYYKTGQEALAETLKKDISSLYTATVEKSDSVVGSYDAVIALGAK